MNSRSGERELVNITADELALVIAYRQCCPEHQKGIRWFANASSSNCTTHTPQNLVVIAPKVRV